MPHASTGPEMFLVGPNVLWASGFVQVSNIYLHIVPVQNYSATDQKMIRFRLWASKNIFGATLFQCSSIFGQAIKILTSPQDFLTWRRKGINQFSL